MHAVAEIIRKWQMYTELIICIYTVTNGMEMMWKCSLLLNKSRYYFNGHGGWFMEHGHTVNRWSDTSTWRKHNLAAAHRLRMASWNTFKAAVMLVWGSASWMNTRLAHHWPVCCHGNWLWNNIWLILFGTFFHRERPRPVVLNRLVRIRKLVKFIN